MRADRSGATSLGTPAQGQRRSGRRAGRKRSSAGESREPAEPDSPRGRGRYGRAIKHLRSSSPSGVNGPTRKPTSWIQLYQGRLKHICSLRGVTDLLFGLH